MIEIDGKQVPTELHELVSPATSALLVIDMQNAYCALLGEDGRAEFKAPYIEVASNIKRLVAAARAADVLIIWIVMITLPEGRSDSAAWLRMLLRAKGSGISAPQRDAISPGSWGAQLISGLVPQPGEPVILKLRSSAFFGTTLDSILHANCIATTIITGCTTEGCIESTVRDAGMRDYFAVVASDCVGSDDPTLHEASMRVMSAYRADIASLNEISATWSQETRVRSAPFIKPPR